MGSTVWPFALFLKLRLTRLINEVPKHLEDIAEYQVPRSSELVP